MYQEKIQLTEDAVQNKVQIIYCKTWHHWIVASTSNCALGEVGVMIPFFSTVIKKQQIITSLFQFSSSKLIVKVAHSQKQKGGTDYGVFTIAFATAITFEMNPSKLQLKQESLRAHLVTCFHKRHISLFPCT